MESNYLDYYGTNPDETDTESEVQLSLLQQDPQLAQRKRVDGAIVRQQFTDAIKKKGGNRSVYSEATQALTQEGFGCSVRDLYDATGAVINQRETLPESAQSAFIALEYHAANDVTRAHISANDQDQRNEQIVDTVRESAKETRKRFLW